jgi:hypothetical protein
MKIITIFCIITTFYISPTILAGEGVVGNGGNIISCNSLITPNQIKFHNKTLELFELNYLYGFNENIDLINSSDEALILKKVITRVKELNEDFYSFLNIELLEFSKNSKHFDFDFNFSNDLGQTVSPKDCLVKTVIFQREIKPFYLISNVWPSLPAVTKASLKLHEVIYRFRLSKMPAMETSLAVRKLNAYLFSTNFFQTNNSLILNSLIKDLEY